MHEQTRLNSRLGRSRRREEAPGSTAAQPSGSCDRTETPEADPGENLFLDPFGAQGPSDR